MVNGLVEMHRGKFKASGAELVMGPGRFVGPKTDRGLASNGGTRTLRGMIVVIDTGRTTIDATPGLSEARPLTHVEALELDQVPGRLSCWAAATSGWNWLRRCDDWEQRDDRRPRMNCPDRTWKIRTSEGD